MIKALDKQNAPYDAFYRTIKLENDNLFTYETILKDLESGNLQAIFLTSAHFSLNKLRDQTKARIASSNPMQDFSLLPISSSMNQLNIMCTTHLLTEANLIDDPDISLTSLEQAKVSDMTAYSLTLNNFYGISYTF